MMTAENTGLKEALCFKSLWIRARLFWMMGPTFASFLNMGMCTHFMHITYQICAHICNIYCIMHIARTFLSIRQNFEVGLAKIYWRNFLSKSIGFVSFVGLSYTSESRPVTLTGWNQTSLRTLTGKRQSRAGQWDAICSMRRRYALTVTCALFFLYKTTSF